MADYDDLDDATLQQMLSDASSYEERSALRQALRKRKKERGQMVTQNKARGTSTYNRFAGSTATKTKTASQPGVSIQPPQSAPKQEKSSPLPKQVKKESPVERPRTPTPPPTPDSTPDPTPEDLQSPTVTTAEETHAPPEDEEGMIAPEEVDGTPVTEEPVEDEPPQASYDEEDSSIREEQKEPSDANIPDIDAANTEVERSSPVPEVLEKTPAEQKDYTDSPHEPEPRSGGKDLQHYLVLYVNKELALDPPLPTKGKGLFDTCSDPTNLCKLINKSVRGTVDLRALSKVRGLPAQRNEAIEENMMLVVESARAIGCVITDATSENIIQKDPETITNFLVDLIRARVVHLPGMEDEASSKFSDWTYLFEKLHISVDSNQSENGLTGREEEEERSGKPKASSWRETGQSDTGELTYEQRAAKRKAEREQRQKKEDEAGSVGLTLEERAVQRKAERERRKKEREALAK